MDATSEGAVSIMLDLSAGGRAFGFDVLGGAAYTDVSSVIRKMSHLRRCVSSSSTAALFGGVMIANADSMSE